MEKPQGVCFEPTADGFRLRASCLSFTDAVMRVGLAACVSVLPFKLWWDPIRDFWSYQGFNFWLSAIFLGVWATAIGYADWIALVSLFGEIRVAKTGSFGEIFTGIGKLGRTRRFSWDDFDGVAEIESRSDSDGHTSVTRYVVLNSQTKRFKFGWQLPEDRRLFVVAALREYAFGAGAAK